MNQELRNEVKSSLKATLTSSPTALTLIELSRDYKNFNGEDIPHRDLGYRSLLDFLRSIPDTVTLTDPESARTLVYPVVDKRTEHINKLVSGQKVNNAKKPFTSKKYCKSPPRPRPRPRSKFPKSDEIISHDFRKDVLNILRDCSDGMPLDTFEYQVNKTSLNHIVSHPFQEILNCIANSTYIANKKIYLKTNNNYNCEKNVPRIYPESYRELDFSVTDSEDDGILDCDDHLSSGSDDKCSPAHSSTNHEAASTSPADKEIDDLLLANISPKLINNLQALFDEPENQKGIWLHDLENKYQLKFGYDLSPRTHGFNDTLELVGNLTNVFRVRKYRVEGDYMLVDARKEDKIHDFNEGNIPDSVISVLKHMLSKRTTGSLSADDLALEYRRHSGKTFDPTEFGFENMDCFLRQLEEFDSDFCFRRVKDRVLISLVSKPIDDRNKLNALNCEVLPQNGPLFDPFPPEVCNTQDKLPSDAFFERLRRDEIFPVVLAEVYTPWRFFLHRLSNVETLNRMMDDLNSFYTQNEEEYEVCPTFMVKGLLCCCQYSIDNRWHRAIILSTTLKTVKVRFVDFGTTENVDVSKLRYLHRDFSKYLIMCVRAKLTGVQRIRNVDPCERDDHDSQVNRSFFSFASCGGLKAKFVNYDAQADCYEVSLHISQKNGKSISVGEYFIEKKIIERKTEEVFANPPSFNLEESRLQNNATPTVIQAETNVNPKSDDPKPSLNEIRNKPPIPTPPPPPPPLASRHPPPPLPTLAPQSPQKFSTSQNHFVKTGPPPGLSLPSPQSLNYKLFSPPLAPNPGLFPVHRPPYNQQPNIPPGYSYPVYGTQVFDPFLHVASATPFNPAAYPLGPSLISSPYYNYPSPPNPSFFQLAPNPPSTVRPPPGLFSPATVSAPSMPSNNHTTFPTQHLVCCDLVSGCSLCIPPTVSSSTAALPKFENPIKDEKLQAEWIKLSKSKTSESNVPPVVHSNAANSKIEKSIVNECLRERKGVEKTFKQLFGDKLGLTSEQCESVRNMLASAKKNNKEVQSSKSTLRREEPVHSTQTEQIHTLLEDPAKSVEQETVSSMNGSSPIVSSTTNQSINLSEQGTKQLKPEALVNTIFEKLLIDPKTGLNNHNDVVPSKSLPLEEIKSKKDANISRTSLKLNPIKKFVMEHEKSFGS